MTTKALTPTAQICQGLDTMEKSLNETLSGTGVSVKRFLATAKTAVQTHVDRSKLEGADRNSLYLAIKKSASDGLMPDNREAALVVYGNTVQYQPMVQGLVKLARNSGEIESINAEVVYENDEFELYHDFDGLRFKHVPNWKSERGEPLLVWAAVKLKSGERMARAYPKARIMQISQRSKMRKNYNPGEGLDWEEFWRKAAIRNILKYAPKSTALERAMEASDVEFEDDATAAPPVPKQEQPKRQTKAEKIVKAEPYQESEIIDIEPETQEEPVDETDMAEEHNTGEEEVPI